ncbi:hypothetical protein NDU88_002861 [Pleurodeles waltl]|uniref:Uncharacterized protein n=1 Tax=Pleurodeles waltl TaxID=8319 RepID=A0AAV7UBR3_PLEWA|nr:hypothetical protein NDU88_002861 [Pleurodeles waltl]
MDVGGAWAKSKAGGRSRPQGCVSLPVCFVPSPAVLQTRPWARRWPLPVRPLLDSSHHTLLLTSVFGATRFQSSRRGEGEAPQLPGHSPICCSGSRSSTQPGSHVSPDRAPRLTHHLRSPSPVSDLAPPAQCSMSGHQTPRDHAAVTQPEVAHALLTGSTSHGYQQPLNTFAPLL